MPVSQTNEKPKGESQLHTACRMLRLKKARSLLAEGANPNTQDHGGRTPLHEVVEAGYTELVSLLLEYGANPNVSGEFRQNNALQPRQHLRGSKSHS